MERTKNISDATRMIKYIATNTILISLLIVGTVYDISGFVAVSIFVFWLTALAGTFGSVPVLAETIYEADNEWKLSVPLWFDCTLDTLVFIMLAGLGYPVLSFFYVLHIFGGMKLRANIIKLQNGESIRKEKDEINE